MKRQPAVLFQKILIRRFLITRTLLQSDPSPTFRTKREKVGHPRILSRKMGYDLPQAHAAAYTFCLRSAPPARPAGWRGAASIPHCILLWSYHDHLGRTAAEDHPDE